MHHYVHVQAIMVLNHAGLVCIIPYCLEVFEALSCRSEVLGEGHWLWMFDNLNVQQHVCHEGQGEGYNNCDTK